MSKSQVQLTVLMLFTEALAGHALGEAEPVVLHGGDGVEATFAQAAGGYRWVGYGLP